MFLKVYNGGEKVSIMENWIFCFICVWCYWLIVLVVIIYSWCKMWENDRCMKNWYLKENCFMDKIGSLLLNVENKEDILNVY